MKKITYLKGDATAPITEGNKIIVHICNDIGGWGKGFVLAISKKWKAPEKSYRDWYKNRVENDFSLGNIQVIKVTEGIFIGNMIAQQGLKFKNNIVPIRYDPTLSNRAKKNCEFLSFVDPGKVEEFSSTESDWEGVSN